MIDIHSHLLPGVDDGAQDVAQGLAMLEKAAADGVRVQILTPHISVRYPNRPEALKEAFDRFVEAAAAMGVKLRLAAEVAIGPDIWQRIVADRMPWIGTWEGRRTFLLEFPAGMIPLGSLDVIRRLVSMGVTPLIAHPERNRQFHTDPSSLGDFIEAGCLAQITAGSIAGNFGRSAFQASVTMLERGWVHFLATDAHDEIHRPPGLRDGLRQAAKIIGEEGALALVRENPARLIGDTETEVTGR